MIKKNKEKKNRAKDQEEMDQEREKKNFASGTCQILNIIFSWRFENGVRDAKTQKPCHYQTIKLADFKFSTMLSGLFSHQNKIK